MGSHGGARLAISTSVGTITLRLRPDAAPRTVEYISKVVASRIYDSTSFYRSDFVIQMGTHGTGKQNPHGDLPVNETHSHIKLSNTRGTAAVAHWDIPDCGNTEFFINLQTNAHLDEAYGGYCVFAEAEGDESYTVINAVAAAVKAQGKVAVNSVALI